MERQQSQRESEVMFLNLPESGVDCPLIQFRDSHICVSLVKVFPLGQSRRSTLKSVERLREGVRCGPGERSGAGTGVAGGAPRAALCAGSGASFLPPGISSSYFFFFPAALATFSPPNSPSCD